jgi:hypothetical protein
VLLVVYFDENPDYVKFVEVAQLLSRQDRSDNNCNLFLSSCHRCSSHSLNLIASHDTAATDSDSSYKRLIVLCLQNVLLYGIKHQEALHMQT